MLPGGASAPRVSSFCLKNEARLSVYWRVSDGQKASKWSSRLVAKAFGDAKTSCVTEPRVDTNKLLQLHTAIDNLGSGFFNPDFSAGPRQTFNPNQFFQV